MSNLERRYRLLLKAYPRPYRQYRADEMLETLLAQPGHRRLWPTMQESVALVVGGLRARTGIERLDSAAWRASALRLSVLSLLVYGITLTAAPSSSTSARAWVGDTAHSDTWWGTLTTPLLLLALVTAAWSLYRLSFAAAILAAFAHLWNSVVAWTPIGPDNTEPPATLYSESLPRQWAQFWSLDSLAQAVEFSTWPSVLAALAILPLLRRPYPRVTRPWAWLIVAAVAATLMTPNPLNGWTDGQQQPILVYALVLATLIGAIIDSRIAIVASNLALVPTLALLAHELLRWKQDSWDVSNTTLLLASTTGILATTLTITAVAARRQATL